MDKYLRIKAQLEAGMTYSAIAEERGVSRQAVHDYCRKQNLKLAPKEKLLCPLEQKKQAFSLGPEYYTEAAARFRRKKQNVINAKKWEWDLEFEDIVWPTHCPILGLELLYFSPFDKTQDASVSFDRIDTNVGYVKGNVHILSWRANRIKNNGSAEEHRKIADYLDSLQET